MISFREWNTHHFGILGIQPRLPAVLGRCGCTALNNLMGLRLVIMLLSMAVHKSYSLCSHHCHHKVDEFMNFSCKHARSSSHQLGHGCGFGVRMFVYVCACVCKSVCAPVPMWLKRCTRGRRRYWGVWLHEAERPCLEHIRVPAENSPCAVRVLVGAACGVASHEMCIWTIAMNSGEG